MNKVKGFIGVLLLGVLVSCVGLRELCSIKGTWVDEGNNVCFVLDKYDADENMLYGVEKTEDAFHVYMGMVYTEREDYTYYVYKLFYPVPYPYVEFSEEYYFNLVSMNKVEGIHVETYTLEMDDGTLELGDMIIPFTAYRTFARRDMP